MSEQTQAVMWYAVKKYLDGELNDDRWQYTVDENEANTFFYGYQVVDGEVLKDPQIRLLCVGLCCCMLF